MKTRIIYIAALIFSLGFSSCEKGPLAGFRASSSVVETDEIIDFTNTSLRANSFDWDFGDGYYSSIIDPSHSYSDPGVYEVSLKAFSGDMMDIVFLTIEVLQATSLEITVKEYYSEDIIPRCEIRIFRSLNDWNNDINGEYVGLTGNNGKLFIEGLDPIRYYIDAYNEEYNNYSLAEEDTGFIETDDLEPNVVNYFIAWVDYDPGIIGKSERKNLRIKKFERKKNDKK